LILTERLTKYYADKPAIRDLDLKVEPGEIFGFLGPNGAGKTTTVKILTGLVRAGSGRAIVAGFDIETHPIEVKKRIGYVPETPALYDSLTGEDFLTVIGALYHLDPSASKARRRDLLELFGLTDARNQRLREFSKGMRQKVIIAAALIHRPDVLILDEPFDGLDANTALVMKDLLRKFAAQGKTILFSSHILEVVERVCTRICIIDRGRKVVEGTTAEILRATASTRLDDAFAKLTGVRDAATVSTDFIAALERV
jgi:ABC-2 type transport system ATP-binding protein